MTARPSSFSHDFRTLSSAILSAIAAPQRMDEDAFTELALRIFRFQHKHNSFYRRYCEVTGAAEPRHWTEIPAVPTSAFKRAEIRSFPPEQTVTFFQTSGTTEGESGRHFFPTLELYEAAIVPNFRAHLLTGIAEPIRMLILTPPPEEAPHSSLVHMMKVVSEDFGTSTSDYFLRGGELQADRLLTVLNQCIRDAEPVFLLGTAFAFVFLMERMRARGRRPLALPARSRIMETGGFKGRTRDIPRPEFYAALSQTFGIPLSHIVNEYGMTELSSQFYDVSLIEGRATAEKSMPRWTRVQAVDPATGRPVPDGEQGLLRIFDLANLGSVMALQTEDVGICRGECFEVLGRVATAQPRGCSLGAEDALRGGDPASGA